MNKALTTVIFCALFPLQALAHNNHADNKPLTSEDITAVIDYLSSQSDFDTVHQPSPQDSYHYFREIAQDAGDLSGEVERVLYMYEAIRLGFYDGEEFSIDADIFVWHRRINPHDYPLIAPQMERLQEWYAQVTSK